MRAGMTVMAWVLCMLPGSVGASDPPLDAPWYAHYQQGLDAMATDAWERAARLIERAVQERSRAEDSARTYGMWQVQYVPYSQLGICYFYLGRDADALAALERADRTHEMSPEDPRRQRTDRIREVLRTRTRAGSRPTETSPRSEDRRLGQALAALLSGEVDHSIDVLKRLAEADEDSAVIHLYLGLAYSRRAAQQRQLNAASWKDRARREFARAREIDETIELPVGVFSEEVETLFDEAVQE